MMRVKLSLQRKRHYGRVSKISSSDIEATFYCQTLANRVYCVMGHLVTLLQFGPVWSDLSSLGVIVTFKCKWFKKDIF